MPVNANSIISTQIRAYDSLLYTSLTDQENYCYITPNTMFAAGSSGLSVYQSEFELLNNSIVSYLGSSRAIMPDLVLSFFSYDMMHSLYGTEYTEALNLPISSLFSMNGESLTIKSAPTSYFADFSTPNGAAASGTNIGVFSNLPSTITNIDDADAIEQSSADAIQANMTSVVKAKATELLFNDIPQTGTAKSKLEIGNLIFGSAAGQFGYKKHNTILNLGLTAPPYVV